MKIFCAFMVFFVLAVSVAWASDIKLEGISGDVILVNGQMRQVGESIDGVKIVSVNGQEVTFEGPDGNQFKKSLKISFWDKMVTDAKNFIGKMKQKKQAAKKGPAKEKSGGLLSGMMGKVKGVPKRDVDNMSLNEKMNLADEDQKAFEKEAEEIIARLMSGKLSPGEVKKETKKFEAAFKKNNDQFNDLKLPCPRSSPQASSSYLAWTKSYQERQDKMINRINRKMQEAVIKAAQAMAN